jgi:hypothetical protein
MAGIDEEAAAEELDRAVHLKAQAEDLLRIAADLEREARDHEHNARDLLAPATT